MRHSDTFGTQFAYRPSSMMKISVHQQSGGVCPIVELKGSRNYSNLSSLSRITPRPLSNIQKQTVKSQKQLRYQFDPSKSASVITDAEFMEALFDTGGIEAK